MFIHTVDRKPPDIFEDRLKSWSLCPEYFDIDDEDEDYDNDDEEEERGEGGVG